jgi:hypothetical protein
MSKEEEKTMGQKGKEKRGRELGADRDGKGKEGTGETEGETEENESRSVLGRLLRLPEKIWLDA